MRTFAAALICLFATTQTFADEPATDASIRELFVVMDTAKMLDGMYGQMDSMMQTSMKQAMTGHQLNAEQQKIIDDMRAKLIAMMQEEMSWRTLEPLMMDIYRKSFTEPEVKGMIQFYKSDVGRAITAKMPLVMQSSMQAAQGRMAALMPQIQRLAQDTAAQLKAACKKECGG